MAEILSTKRVPMKVFIRSKKYVLNIILALIAIGVEYYYSTCETACSYLKGDVFGIGLQYIGVAFMIVIVILSIIKKDLFLLLLLSAGVGVEIYLVGFQIWYKTYCVYCLIFGGILMIQFFINLDWKKIKTVFIVMAVALLIFPIFFHGSVTPVYAAEDLAPPKFGKGPVQIWLYSDYFCPACRAMEPKIEPIVSKLVRNNLITFTFIDAPSHQVSLMYARYFLYAMHENKDIDAALAAKNVLFTASVEKITDATKLENVLKAKGIKFKAYDTTPVFNYYGNQFQSNKIKEVPSCVIEQSGGKDVFVGDDIPGALEKLLR